GYQGGGGQTEGAADAEGGAHQGGGGTEPFGGQFVAHDADAERDDAGRQTLQHPADDHRGQGVAERGRDRTGDQHHQADQEHAALAIHVPQPSHDRGGDGRREQGGGDGPGGVGGRGVQELGQFRDDRD